MTPLAVWGPDCPRSRMTAHARTADTFFYPLRSRCQQAMLKVLGPLRKRCIPVVCVATALREREAPAHDGGDNPAGRATVPPMPGVSQGALHTLRNKRTHHRDDTTHVKLTAQRFTVYGTGSAAPQVEGRPVLSGSRRNARQERAPVDWSDV